MKNKYCGKTYEDIKEFIELYNCKLLTSKNEYENYKTKLNIICNCGNKFTTSFEKFLHRNKRQCNTCGLKKEPINLEGKKFNHLTPIKLDSDRILQYKNKGKYVTYWLCECDCGNPNLISVSYGSLISDGTKSCGCIHELNLTGKKFHKLTVIDYAFSKNGHTYWNCKCDCGKETIILGTAINTGKSKSCGCYNAESKMTHGLSEHPLYHVFNTMKQRCYNSNSEDYYLYGARNIIICDEWLKDFLDFYNWAMNSGYQQGLEIDRIDTNGNYEPINCRWVDDIDQANNTSRNINITIDNITKTFAEWCRFYNKKTSVVRNRVKNGWNILEALMTDTDGNQHFNKDFMIELDGEYKTLTDWCRYFDRKYSTVYKRLKNGWNLKNALTTPTTKGKHYYNLEKLGEFYEA